MGYSDKDLESTYENLVNSEQYEISVWNSHSVYFDDEIVEYQSKHYMALCKTSAEVPGRSKAGIWKEVSISEEEPSSHYNEVYEEFPPKEKNQEYKGKEDGKDRVLQKSKRTEEIQKNSVAPKAKAASPIVPEQQKTEIRAVRNTAKLANKPLLKKKTLSEQAEQIHAQSTPIVSAPIPSPMKKMQIVPNEQSLVNELLKEMAFKKIKGFNPDDNTITTNLILPQTKEGARLEWNSSHPSIISSKGEVTQPVDGNDVAVNLSLTVHINKTSATRFFTLWVKAEEQVLSDEECVEIVDETLTFEHIKGLNIKASVITQNLELLTHGLYDTTIFWASKSRELLDESGTFHKVNLSKNTKVRIYAIIVKGNAEKLKHFDLILKV